MVKYRIKQKGRVFYPQEKTFIFWHRCKDNFALSIDGTWHCTKSPLRRSEERVQVGVGDIELQTVIYSFKTLDEAKMYLNGYKRRSTQNLTYKGHRIIETYNSTFIDVSCNVYYYDFGVAYSLSSKSLDDLKFEIDRFEKKWEESKIRKTYKV